MQRQEEDSADGVEGTCRYIHVHKYSCIGCVTNIYRTVPLLGEENMTEKEKAKARICEMKKHVEKICPNVTQNGSIQISV